MDNFKYIIDWLVKLNLTWSKNCALADMTEKDTENNDDPPAIVAPTKLEFQITGRKLYVPVVTLSTENDKKLLEQSKSGFKGTVKWNKYRSQTTIQNNNNNLNYLIDPTFTKVNRLFVSLFARIARKKKIVQILCHVIVYQMLKWNISRL